MAPLKEHTQTPSSHKTWQSLIRGLLRARVARNLKVDPLLREPCSTWENANPM